MRHRDEPGTRGQQRLEGGQVELARGVFQGRIVVAEGADRTDARMEHHALILSDRAEVDAKPELEIYADDVKCAHGASVGELDETALFYLRTRGIPEAEARQILIEGFLREPVEEIADPSVRDYLLRRLSRRLEGLEA